MEIKTNFIVNESGQKISVILPIEKYNELIAKLAAEEKRITELEDELDIKLSKEILNSNEDRIDFDIKNYV